MHISSIGFTLARRVGEAINLLQLDVYSGMRNDQFVDVNAVSECWIIVMLLSSNVSQAPEVNDVQS
jgi:hypothetical protein